MIFEKRLSLSKKTWIILFMVFCLIVGGLMMLSISHIFPVIIEQLKVEINPKEILERPPHPAFSIPEPSGKESEPIYTTFLPVVSQGRVVESHQQSKIVSDDKIGGINLAPGSASVTITVVPDSVGFDDGMQVEIHFSPGYECTFGEGRACVYSFLNDSGSRILFASIHSGVGGEADAFRDLIEGTGINQGLYGLEIVEERMQALTGAEITISQGDEVMAGLRLLALVRIAPEYLTTYHQLPVEDTLTYAVQSAGLDPVLLQRDLLVLETCGWRLPGEHQFDTENTSSSIYLGLVGLDGE